MMSRRACRAANPQAARWLVFCLARGRRGDVRPDLLLGTLSWETGRWTPSEHRLSRRNYRAVPKACFLIHINVVQRPLKINKQAVGGRPPRYAPPRPATEARSGSLEPGRPSRARSANTRHPAGRPHRHPPTGCTRQTSDRRQTADRQTSDSIIA